MLRALTHPRIRTAHTRYLRPLQSFTMTTKVAPNTTNGTGAAAATPRPLSRAEEYAWSRPSVGMTRFHDSHKHTFNRSYDRADDYYKYSTLQSFLRESYNLVVHLGNHHAIEEAYIFPLLAAKHPAFREGAEHKEAHQKIHDGLERYSAFLRAAMADEKKYSAKELRAILDSFREPLFEHLDQEVEDLKPATLMANGFTLDEIRQLPF